MAFDAEHRMATCPRCFGPLTDNHRCPRVRSRGFSRMVGLPLVGAALGTAACYGLVDRPHGLVVLFSALLGAVLADAVRRAVAPGI